jgi:hypothetical protein
VIVMRLREGEQVSSLAPVVASEEAAGDAMGDEVLPAQTGEAEPAAGEPAAE